MEEKMHIEAMSFKQPAIQGCLVTDDTESIYN
jgi:hypothetical protein